MVIRQEVAAAEVKAQRTEVELNQLQDIIQCAVLRKAIAASEKETYITQWKGLAAKKCSETILIWLEHT